MSYIHGYDPDTLREQVDPRACKDRLDEIGEQRIMYEIKPLAASVMG